MSTIEGLRKMAQETEEGSAHQGYWYCISDALVLLVCGMLCNLQTIEDNIRMVKSAAGSFVFERVVCN